MNADRGTIHAALCIVAIIIGVLFYANVLHVGVDHKAIGVVEATLGILGLV